MEVGAPAGPIGDAVERVHDQQLLRFRVRSKGHVWLKQGRSILYSADGGRSGILAWCCGAAYGVHV